MSAISTYLEHIRSKIYAKDVRTAIVNAISQCYDDVNKPALQTEAMQAAVQAKIDAGEMAALTIADGTITAAKFASGVIDSTLTQVGAAADAKVTGDAIVGLKNDLAPYTSSVYYRQLFTRSGLDISIGNRVSVVDTTTRLSMPELQYAKSAISLSINTGYQFAVITCDSDNIAIADSGWKTTFAISSGTYFHVTMRKSDNSDITLDDIYNIFIDEDEFNCTDIEIAIVNNQITSIKNQITSIKNSFEPYSSEAFYRELFAQKKLILSVGQVVTAQDSITRLSILDLQYAKSPITITVDSSYRFAIETCDANNILLNDSGWQTGTATILAGTYYHVVVAKKDGEEIPLTDVSHIYMTEEGFSAVDFMVEELESQIASLDSNVNTDNLAIMNKYECGYLSDTGALVVASTANERTTDYINLNGNSGVTVQEWGTPVSNGMWVCVTFYTDSKEWISRLTYLSDGTTHVSKYFPAPSNAAYARVSFRQGNDILLMVNYGNKSPAYLMAKEDIYYLNHPTDTDVIPRALIKSINHRGYNSIAPENTLPAYKLSKLYGFEYVETDIEFTSDGVAVLLHDSTIDRTSDGTGNIADMTYSQVSQYDFGSWKSADYAGTKIPTFEEFVILCKNIGLKPYIELKVGTKAQIEALVTTVRSCGMINEVTWISFQSALLSYVIEKDEKARVGYLPTYGTDIDDADITKAQSLLTGSNEVFINVQMSALTATGISKAVSAKIPVEVYDGGKTNIKTMNPYITGVTADVVVTDLCLYENAMQ